MNTWLELVMPHIIATHNISFDCVDSFFAFSNNVLKVLISGQSITLPLAFLLL